MKTKIFLLIVFIAIIAGLIYSRNSLSHRINQLHNQNARQENELIDIKHQLENLSLDSVIGSEYAKLLTIYTAYDANGPLKFIRLGKDNDGGYVVPELALQSSYALLGYGIDKDISFEDDFSNRYNRDSYAFDCSTKDSDITITNKLTKFIPECLGTGEFSWRQEQQIDGIKTSTFEQSLNRFNLKGKKVFVKLDIEGAEFSAISEILKNSQDITGMALEIHLDANSKLNFNQQVQSGIDLLKTLDKDFVLVHLTGNNCRLGDDFNTKNSQGAIPRLIELTYINKNLIDKAEVAEDQSHPSPIDSPSCARLEDKKFTILPMKE